jgi:hypothetical protein
MQTNTSVFLILISLVVTCSGLAAPVEGKTYSLNLIDVDGRTLSTTDGHITVLVLAQRKDVDKARLVGDRIPERYLGNPKSQMITVIRFDQTQNRTMRFVLSAMVRRNLNAEATRLKSRYRTKGISRDPRPDIHAVADFDGQIASQLGVAGDSAEFRVLILSRSGVLLRDWSGPPTAEQLAAALP